MSAVPTPYSREGELSVNPAAMALYIFFVSGLVSDVREDIIWLVIMGLYTIYVLATDR